MSESHYTDKHLTQRGSSIDIIERCAAFMRQAGDFEGILDYAADDDDDKVLQNALRLLVKAAMHITRKECGNA